MKRWLAKLVVFLVLGAVVNVAVAWGCAAFATIRGQAVHQPGADDWMTAGDGSRLAQKRVFIQWLGVGADGLTVYASSITFTSDGLVQNWVSADFTGRAGLPIRCLRGRYVQRARDSAPGFAGAWPLSRFSSPTYAQRAVAPPWQRTGLAFLPLRPIWPGFAANTIFYAAVLWMLTLGPSTARRMIRRKRGLCINCGYDLRHADHDACPECGAEV